jgi:hypothetical protein
MIQMMQIIVSLSSTHDFVVLTFLTHPRKILLIVLQIGKAKDLSASLRIVIRVEWRRIDVEGKRIIGRKEEGIGEELK